MASSILFLEYHDKKTIWEDVDFVTSLNPEYLQFMQLGPLPGTKLYKDYENEGKLLPDLPYESKHGQGKIWFHHDHFNREESKEFLRLAFEIDYNRNGASLLRVMKTAFGGYLYCEGHADARIRERVKYYKKLIKKMRHFLGAAQIFIQNRRSEILLQEIKNLYSLHFGKMDVVTVVASTAVVFFSI